MQGQLLFLPFAGKISFLDNEIDIIEKIPLESHDREFFIKITDVYGVLGQITVNHEKYVLFVNMARMVLDCNTFVIHRVEKIKVLNVSKIEFLYKEGKIYQKENRLVLECNEITKEITNKSKEMKNFLNFLHESPFYFSTSKIEDDKYLWNGYILSEIEKFKNSNGILYLYNGFFNMSACTHYKYFLTSFISSNRVGPRFFSRGVDSDGNVSNFVKTRYFVQREDNISLDVIIYRGSVPIYWEQPGSLRELNFVKKDNFLPCFRHFYSNFRDNCADKYDSSKDLIKAQEINSKKEQKNQKYYRYLFENSQNVDVDSECDTKFQNSIDHFNHILVINLLSNKKDEKKLSDFYTELLDSLKIANFTFNLNKYHLNYKKLKALFIDELHQNVLNIQEKMLIRKSQLGKIIYRVNCLDCLDRTNLASYLICDYYHSQLEIPKDNLKALFQENGNVLSLFNAGSHALRNELAVKEKRSIKGLMDDFYIFTKRVLHDKFNDKQKMEYIDQLLGKKDNHRTEESIERDPYQETSAKRSDFGNAISSQSGEFHKSIQVPQQNIEKKCFVLITMKISSKKDLKNFNFIPSENTSLVIFCINKMVSAIMSVFSDENICYSIPNYLLISKKSNFNTHILIYVKENERKRISNISHIQKKRALQFTKRNCFISVSFEFDSYPFLIYNVILDRISDYSFFQTEHVPNQVYLLTGTFLNENQQSLFESLDCNYIETQSDIKVAFKGSISGKDFQEYQNVNFFTFTF